MSGLPWSKFFWSDYASDPALKICSLAAQGLWMRMLCIAAEHEPPGYVAVNGEGLEPRQIAALSGASLDEVGPLLDELGKRGVFKRDRRGWIYSKRMINDAKKRRDASENGKKGGNPKLRKPKEKSGEDKGGAKGEEKGASKPHMPEARVQSKKTPTESQKTRLPDDWEPGLFGAETEAGKIRLKWSDETFASQLERFKDHHRKVGSKFVDWQAAWGTWVRNSKAFAQERREQHHASTGNSYLDHVVANVIPKLAKGS